MEEIIKTKMGEYNVTPDGDMSDGAHTFTELYKHRMMYNACFLREIVGKYKVERSKRHNDGELCFGGDWFIVVAELPTGQISNHYDLRYWDLFDFCETVERPTIVFDGHTTKDVINRMYNYIKYKEIYHY